MTNIKILGLSGKSYSGKDWIARHILASKGFHNIGLAWQLKMEIIARGLATYNEVFITKPPEIRELLQQRGTEMGRTIYGENMWAKAAFSWIRLLHTEWGIDKFVITDVRFPNEVDYIRENNGKVVRIYSPMRVASSPLSPDARTHASEIALDEYDKDIIYGNTYYDDVWFNDLPHPGSGKITPEMMRTATDNALKAKINETLTRLELI